MAFSVFIKNRFNDSQATIRKIPHEVGSLKTVKNNNKIIDTGEFMTTFIDEKNVFFSTYDDLLKGGMLLAVHEETISNPNPTEYTYVIETVKKKRVSISSGFKVWQYFVTFTSLESLLQRVILPNTSLKQLVVGTPKLKKEMIDKYLELYLLETSFGELGKPLTFTHTYSANDGYDLAYEFTWQTPTLYDVISDIAEPNQKIIASVSSNGSLNISYYDVTTIQIQNLNESLISGFEENMSVDYNPNSQITMIENAFFGEDGIVFEKGLSQVSDDGVLKDDDDLARIETSFGIQRIKKIYAYGDFGEASWSGGGDQNYIREAGTYKLDITDYVITKELHDLMLVKPSGILADVISEDDIKYRNFFLYYERGKNFVGGILSSLKAKKIVITHTNFSINMIATYIGKYDKTKIISSPEMEWHNVAWFKKEDAKHFKFEIEYEPVDDFRIDFIRGDGVGSVIHNQSQAFVNIDRFITEQERAVKRLDGVEKVAMGRYSVVINPLLKPKLGYHYKGDVVAQLTEIYFDDFVEFMVILTSPNNRVDGNAYVSAQKRFYNIVDVSDSIRRYEYFEKTISASSFNDMTLPSNLKNIYGLMTTYQDDETHITRVWLKPAILVKNDEIYLFFKTTDNKYISKRQVRDGSYYISEGVFYTDKDTGEFGMSKLKIVSNSSLPNSDYPKASNEWDENYTEFGKTEFIRLKDTGESLAFTIKLIKGT